MNEIQSFWWLISCRFRTDFFCSSCSHEFSHLPRESCLVWKWLLCELCFILCYYIDNGYFFLQKTWLKSHYCDCTHSSHCFEHEQKLIARFRNSPSWSLVTNLLFRITGSEYHSWIKLAKSRDFIKRGFMSNCFKPWFQNVKIQMLSISWICKWFLTDLRLGL